MDHLNIDSNLSGPNTGTVSGNPNAAANESIDDKKFKDRIDNNFKNVLKSIGMMGLVLSKIEKKQDETITILKEGIKAGKTLDEKVDSLQDTLEEIEETRQREKEEDEKQRREDELEQRNKNTLLTTGTPEQKNNGFGFSPKMWAGIFAGAVLLDAVGKMQPQINSFLGFLRSSSAVISSLTGVAAGGIQATKTTVNSSKYFGAFENTMEKIGVTTAAKVGGISAGAAGAARVLYYLKWLQRLGWALMVLDPLVTLVSSLIKGEDYNGIKKAMAKSFGRILGGYFGAIYAGQLSAMLLGMTGGAVGGPVGAGIGGVVGFVLGAIAGGYYGTQYGEAIGEAFYTLFASDFKDTSGFEKIATQMKKDMYNTLDTALTTVGGVVVGGVDYAAKSVGVNIGAPQKPPITPNYPSQPNQPSLPSNNRRQKRNQNSNDVLNDYSSPKKGILYRPGPNWRNVAANFIAKNEGYVDHIALDTDGHKIWGYSTAAPDNLPVGTPVPFEQALDELYDSIDRMARSIIKKIGEENWNKLNDNQKAVLLDQMFNAGFIPSGVKDLLNNNNIEGVSKRISEGPTTAKTLMPDGSMRSIENKGLKKRVDRRTDFFNSSPENIIPEKKEPIQNPLTPISTINKNNSVDVEITPLDSNVDVYKKIEDRKKETGAKFEIGKSYIDKESGLVKFKLKFESQNEADKFYGKQKPTPVAIVKNDGQNMLKNGPADKKIVIINNNSPQATGPTPSVIPQTPQHGGLTSGSVPMAYAPNRLDILQRYA